MKHVCWSLCMLLSCVLLVGCTSLHAATADSGPWRQVRQMQPEHSVAMVGFLDGDRGLTVGCQGLVRYTADGGATWHRADSRGECL